MSGDEGTVPTAALERLVAGHREFLAFLERRVGDRAVAEDLLQDAFVRCLEKGHELREEESARAWFYRVLRNAIVDRSRRQQVTARKLADLAKDLEDEAGEAAAAVERAACACMVELLDNLPADQAQALRRVELEGARVIDFAREAGISENNAGVRVFRARRALREQVTRACGTCAEHGCIDCCCKRG